MPRTQLSERGLSLLKYPGADSLGVDSPETTIKRRELIRNKVFLRRIYEEWYAAIAAAIPRGDKPVLELGSGAGFMSDHVPGILTSDILELPGVDLVVDACQVLPFEDAGVRGIAMVNVLHHLPDVEVFLSEAGRCLEPGATISMIEPWNTPWSRFVYGRLHPEPFEPAAASWQFESFGPLSSANGALPWIVFVRDRKRFERRYPELELNAIRPLMPIRYLLSGGVSMRALVPSWSFDLFTVVERACAPAMASLAMFAHITVSRR